MATHEADHRFSVEGFVCGPDSRPLVEEKVVVKDTRAGIGKAVYTDHNGYYKVTLHLHNDNLRDPLRITVEKESQEARVAFDPKDTESERIIRVNFGKGCAVEPAGPLRWVLYGAGVLVVVGAWIVGLQAMKKSKKRAKKKEKGRNRT